MHDFFLEILRNPARSRRAGLMHQFHSGQLDSTTQDLDLNLESRSVSRSRMCVHTLPLEVYMY